MGTLSLRRGGIQGGWAPRRRSTHSSQEFCEKVGWDLRLSVVIVCENLSWGGGGMGDFAPRGYVHGREGHFIFVFCHITLPETAVFLMSIKREPIFSFSLIFS